MPLRLVAHFVLLSLKFYYKLDYKIDDYNDIIKMTLIGKILYSFIS